MIVLSGAEGALARIVLPMLRNTLQVCAFDDAEGSPGDADFLSRLFDRMKPHTYLHLSRMDDIEHCEYAREDAYRVNGFIPGEAAKLCAARGVRFVFLSSAYVFDGRKARPYTEDDPADPATVFGDSLLLGERLVRESGCDSLIARLPDIYGAGAGWMDAAMGTLAGGETAHVIRERCISPLSAADVARITGTLLSGKHTGLYHCASTGSMSAADFLRGFARILGFVRGHDGVPGVRELSYEEFVSPVEWPANTMLDAGRLCADTGIECPGWERSLEEFVRARFSP
ncbi:MAG: NAD-dependent epimerase/dehydratase family protein [Spirochaetes bacterium]|nr:MAG: NAD-dependent epimerase/dehydratase family protein [Spirochaetota bacterium]